MEALSGIGIFLVAFVLFTLYKGVKIVPQGFKWIVPVSYTHLTLPTICSV